MELKEMTIEELQERASQIATEIEQPEANLDDLEAEARSIKEELEHRKAIEAEKAEKRSEVASGKGETKQKFEERKKMSDIEIRNSKEYINAFAEYIKSEDPSECRALLSENVDGGKVAVPDMVYDIVKTAWAKEGIMSRVRKAYIRGNLKVGFEISATGAYVHTEGATAVSEETLVLGTVELKPVSIKKWISVSDEALDLRGEAFLRYLYDELTYQIAKKAADQLIAKIEACGTESTTTCVGVPVVTAASIAVGTIASALGNLSDEAANPTIMMNKLTWAAFKSAQYGAGYAVDPFEGLDVVFNNTIKAFSAASTGDTYVIVGDLGQGAMANFPNGEEIDIKFDDTTLMTQDLVRILGREYIAIEPVAPNAFVKVKK